MQIAGINGFGKYAKLVAMTSGYTFSNKLNNKLPSALLDNVDIKQFTKCLYSSKYRYSNYLNIIK